MKLKFFLMVVPAIAASQFAFGSEIIPLVHCGQDAQNIDDALTIDVHLVRGVQTQYGREEYVEAVLTKTTIAGTRSDSFSPLRQPPHDGRGTSIMTYSGHDFELDIYLDELSAAGALSHVTADTGQGTVDQYTSCKVVQPQ